MTTVDLYELCHIIGIGSGSSRDLTSTLTLRTPSSNIISLISSVSISEQLKLTRSCLSGLLLFAVREEEDNLLEL